MKNVSIMFLFSAIMCVTAYSQTTVPAGDGTLSAAIAAASDGAVLQLSPSGSYTENILFNLGTLNKKITILGRSTSSQTMPKVTVTTPGGTRNYFMMTHGASLTVKGVDFDGRMNGNDSVSHLVQFTVTGTDTNRIYRVELNDCHIHNLSNTVLEGNTAKGTVYVDTTIINNVIMHDAKTTVFYKTCGADYLSVKNSTFYRIRSYGLRIGGPANSGFLNHTTEAVIDHTTWNDITQTDERNVILLEGGTAQNLKPWKITNSIITNQSHAVQSVNTISLKGLVNPGTITKVCWWDIANTAPINLGNTVTDTLRMNPQFKDTVNGDFKPMNTALPLGTDGKVLGDTRWGPLTKVEDFAAALPTEFSVEPNYPNPFNPTTNIRFSLPTASNVTVKVFNLLGQEAAVVFSGNKAAGTHTVQFDASRLGSGVYLYKVEAGRFVSVKKMILMK